MAAAAAAAAAAEVAAEAAEARWQLNAGRDVNYEFFINHLANEPQIIYVQFMDSLTSGIFIYKLH